MKYFVLSTLSLFLFTACQQEDLEIPDTGRKIVINGLIATDTLLNVYINKSAYIISTGPVFHSDLENADVNFYQNSIRIDSLYHFNMGINTSTIFYAGNYWSKSVFPLPGMEYKIVAKVPGLPDATATTTIPDLVRIERVDTSRIIFGFHGHNYRMIFNIEFTDPANETNYYLFRMSSFGFKFNSHNNSFASQDPIIEEEMKNGSNSIEGVVFSDKLINGQKHNLTVSTNGSFSSNGPKKTIMYLRLYSITDEYFKYIQTLNLYNAKKGNPLAEPVIVYSNITGGLGIFAGAAVSTDSIVVPY
jgi:hypothetical protein